MQKCIILERYAQGLGVYKLTTTENRKSIRPIVRLLSTNSFLPECFTGRWIL